MSVDQVAEISPMVRKVFESPSDGMCATFEVAGNSGAWAQVMKGTINAAYPLETAPEGHLPEVLACLPGSTVTAWEAGKFVTVMFESNNPQDVAKAVDQYFEKFFDVGDYSLDCRLEDM
jgi:hypothetical protein